MFKIDPTFSTYWPPLPGEKFIILEKSILDEGLRENLIVWKEKNVLLDGHQRLRILQKHDLSYENRITYLSFPDEVHAKHWVHVTQAARRGDAPQFLSICHVLEFEPLYREWAKERQKEHGGTAPGKKKHSVTNGDEVLDDGYGRTTDAMARDACCSKNSIERVLYIRKHDPKRFKALKELAEQGKDYEKDDGPGRGKGTKEISIHLEHSKVKAMVDAKEKGIILDSETIEKFPSSNTVRDFAETVTKFKPPIGVQKSAAKAIIADQSIADKNYIEDAVIHRMPKRKSRKEKEKPSFEQMRNSMEKIAGFMNQAIEETRQLMRLKDEFGDDLYFQVLAEASNLRAAFAEWVVQAKYINRKGDDNGKKENKESRLLHS